MESKRRKSMRKLLAARDGVAALEFALCVPVVLFAILGVIEFGRALADQNALNYAVQDTARCITITPSACSDPASYASTTSGMTFDTSVFSVTTPTPSCGNQVEAAYTFQFLTNLINISELASAVGLSGLANGITLTAQACYPTPF